jgi:hypothetical protein
MLPLPAPSALLWRFTCYHSVIIEETVGGLPALAAVSQIETIAVVFNFNEYMDTSR